jgi:tetratricopeptide (TPR) repeat protein
MSKRRNNSNWFVPVYNKASDLNKRGIAAEKSGDLVRAIQLYSAAIQENPTNYIYYHNRSLARYKRKDYKGCLQDIGKSISCSAGVAGVNYRIERLFNQSLCLFNLRRYDEAITCITTYLEHFVNDFDMIRM